MLISCLADKDYSESIYRPTSAVIGGYFQYKINMGDFYGVPWDCDKVAVVSVGSQFAFDNRNRVTSETTVFNGNTATVELAYDKLGRLGTKTLGSGVEAVTETLSYTLQGWLSGSESELFTYTLRYQDPVMTATNGAPGKVGNITEWTWEHSGQTSRTYSFSYDSLSRLTGSNYYTEGDTLPSNKFTERDIKYDRNGNIKTLKRYGTNNSVPDKNLVFSYNGNKRSGYGYDGLGNVTYDPINDLNIAYNLLYLPRRVDSEGQVKALYTYLADGTKAAALNSDGSIGLVYLGSTVFLPSGSTYVVESAAFSSGRIFTATSPASVNYHLTDHLGSVRVIFDGNKQIREFNDYYPFGLRYSEVPQPQLGTTNRHKFGGKELQNAVGLEYLDFIARQYDPAGAMFLSVDPRAEKYYNLSHYGYAANNPIFYIDPRGDTLNVSSASASATTAYHQINKDAMGGFYETSFDANGNVVITSTGIKGTMTDEQKKYHETLSTVVNSTVTTSINVVENDNSITVGDINTKTIDVGDMNAIDQNNQVVKAGNLMAHEVWEQFNIAYGIPKGDAHVSASHKEGYIGNYTRDPISGAVETPDISRPGAGNTKLIIRVDRSGRHSVYIIDLTNKNVTNFIKRENP